QDIIWKGGTEKPVVKITHALQSPAGRKSWAVYSANIKIVLQIPDRRLMCASVLKQKVRVAVVVHIAYQSSGYSRRRSRRILRREVWAAASCGGSQHNSSGDND